MAIVPKSMHWKDKQEFHKSDIVRWKEALKRALPLRVSEIFTRVLEASDSHVQLSDIKKLDAALHQLLLSGGCPDKVLNVLVEMHSACTSRHPVQRAIASVLQRLPTSQLSRVVECIGNTVVKVISGQWISDNIKVLQYIETLMENFPSGENAVMERLPLVVQHCVSVISTYSKDNDPSESVLILAMKVTMNVLHKMSTVLRSLLGSPQSATGDSMLASIAWPEGLAEKSDEGKSHWIQQQLQHIQSYCESLLQTAATVPHDTIIAGAMLYAVAVVTRFDGEDLKGKIKELKSGLLEKGSRWLPFAQLAVCHAMLAKLPSHVLIGEAVEQKPLLLVLFPIVCKLFESFSESSDRYVASRTLALWTTVARDCIEQIGPEPLVYEALLPSGEIVQTLLQFVWTLWEDPIDGIRHQCNEIFGNVIRISLKLKSGDFLQSLAKTLLSLETPTRGKYILLTSLTQHVPVGTILETSPDLPQELLRAMGHQVLACHAGELWSRLVTLHWQSLGEDKLEIWCETWVRALVHRMCCSSPLARQHTVQYCLLSLLQCTGKCILYIKRSLEANSEASPESKLVTQLACLRCAKNERKDFIWEESFNSICSVAMHHADEQVRVSALGLLCESHRSTEPPQLSSLPLVLQFMELNANSQSPGFRYPVLTAIKKLLIRIKDSSYALVKQHQKGHAASPDEVIAAHQAFLHRMLEQQFVALNPLSSYQRRNFVISVLQLLSTIFPDQSTEGEGGIPPVFEFGSAVSESQTRCLLNSLQDSYDPNRAGALELLLRVPENKLGFEDEGFLKQCTSTYYRLATSPKAVNCTTASFLLQLLVCRRGKDFNEALGVIVKQASDIPNERAPQFTTIRILCKLLLQHISQARENLVRASIAAPMYGALQSVRIALKEAISRAPILAALSTYQEMTAEIIGVCETVASIVSPVVCNSSPEGFLPEAAPQLESSQMAEGAPASVGSAQSLLLCCWHSMKEISLLLGFIVESSPDTQQEDSILTSQQLDTIASIFIHQLTEARHRGAFEMAYTGFSKLCQYLWRSSSHELHANVSVWVEELLDSLQSTSRSKILSVTRRSAGLPFYLQAILCAEPSHTGRQCLKTTMRTLLRVAKSYGTLISSPDSGRTDASSSSESQHQSVAVHALNILRALYKDSRLGETIVPFIPDGVMIAIEGFAAIFWPIRNSSTLLFSALFTRIFGAKRAQDEHSMENKTTAKEFFSRFPTLYQFLLQQLRTSAQRLETQEKSILQPSLFPVLLLLSRLYPSVLDDVNSPFTLKPFLPLLIKCVSCGEWKGRVLISRAIMPMVTAVNVESLVCQLGGQLNLRRQNQLHGLLLILERMVTDHSKLFLLDCDGHSSVAHLLLHMLLDKQVISSGHNPCVATQTLYLDVLVGVVRHLCEQKTFDGITEQDQLKLVQEAESDPKEPTLSPNLFIARARLLLLLTWCIDESKRRFSVNSIYSKCLQLRNQAVRLFALEHLNRKELQLSVSDVEAICPIVVSLLRDETSEDVLAQTYTFLASAVEAIGSKCLKCHDSDSEGDHMQIVHQALVMATQEHIRVELQVSLIHFITVALNSAQRLDDSKTIAAFLAVLEANSTPTKPVELHIAVATELSGLWDLVLKELGNVGTFCRLALLMLQDVDQEVREKAASSLGSVLQSLPQGHSLSDPLLPLQSPNAPSVLKWFLKMISVMLPREIVLDILLGLLALENNPPVDNSSGNVLFDEDRLNDYLEEVVLARNICDCIEDFVHIQHSLPGSELQPLVERLIFQLQSIHPKCSVISPWEQQYTFLYICKLVFLSKALLQSLDVHYVVTLKKAVSSVLTECASLHPIFHIHGFI